MQTELEPCLIWSKMITWLFQQINLKKSVTVIYFHSFSAEISLKCQVMGDYQINKCCMIFLKAPKVNLHVKEEHNRLHKNI